MCLLRDAMLFFFFLCVVLFMNGGMGKTVLHIYMGAVV